MKIFFIKNNFKFSVTTTNVVAKSEVAPNAAQHECGFCGILFESLKYLQIHLNICNNPKINKSGPKSQHGKRKREDSRNSTSRHQINPIGEI